MNDFKKRFVWLPCGIIQPPIFPEGTGQERTLNIATHCNNHIHLWNVGQELTVLGCFHVNAIYLLHQPDGILIDLRLCFCACGIAFKHIACQLFSQRFCNLAAAGIVDTDKCYFLHIRIPACAAISPHRRLSEPCPWKLPSH